MVTSQAPACFQIMHYVCHWESTVYHTYIVDPIFFGISLTGLQRHSLPRFFLPDFPDGMFCYWSQYLTVNPWEVDSSDVIWGMNLHACKPSFYRGLVSRDTIWLNVIAGNFWWESETQGIKGTSF